MLMMPEEIEMLNEMATYWVPHKHKFNLSKVDKEYISSLSPEALKSIHQRVRFFSHYAATRSLGRLKVSLKHQKTIRTIDQEVTYKNILMACDFAIPSFKSKIIGFVGNNDIASTQLEIVI
jgi:hypothetical protein